MSDTILRLPDVRQRTGLSRTTIYSFIKTGAFPSQVCLGARAVGWLEREVDLWIDKRVAMRAGGTK